MWDNVKSILGTAAPIIGTLIGGPAGTAVGSLVASALGVENTPHAIEQELKNNPEALVKLKQLEFENQVQLKKIAFETFFLHESNCHLYLLIQWHDRHFD